MHAYPVTHPGRSFAIISIVRVATIIVLALALALTFVPLLARAATGSAFVRVNQVGYATTASKRAYLMASGVETGATFSVKNASGATVYSAPIGANLGSWSTSYPDVYALDFGSVTTAGTYTIVASGPIAGSSPSFTIGTAANVYAGALSNALSFYQNERDGANYISSGLRTAPGHLNDANAMTYLTPNANSSGRFSGDLSPLGVRIDASGAWWDAGDYLKFVQTISYTVDIQELGVRDFPNQMGTGSTTSNFNAETKFGLDWLQHMWDDSTQT
ncbi:MAG: cellulase N-terminal Ig-like domain-containing protein, partial [Ktedonobacteraceae bacterium]